MFAIHSIKTQTLRRGPVIFLFLAAKKDLERPFRGSYLGVHPT